MTHTFIVDVDLSDILGNDYSNEEIEDWFKEHKEEYILNLYEHARTELKYFFNERYPLKN